MEKFEELGPNPFAFAEQPSEQTVPPEIRVVRLEDEDPENVRRRMGMHAGKMTAGQWYPRKEKGQKLS